VSGLAWNSALITCLNALTLVAGLVLYPFIAKAFDANATDAFFMALTIPWLVIGPVMNAVSSTLIPVLTECRLRRPETVARLVGSAITNGVLVSVIAALLLGALTPTGLTLAGSSLSADAIARVRANTFLLLPLVVLQTVTSVLDAASNAAKCFWLPASATLLQQLATLGAIALLSGPFGDHTLAIGFAVGAAAHLAMLVAFWRHADTSVRLGWRIPSELRTAWRLAVPLLVATAALQVGVLLSRFVAAGLGPGSVTALDYAYRVTMAVVEVSSSGLLLVILADWSATVVNGNPAELRTKLRNVMPLVLFTLLPMVFVLHALRLPVVTVWLGTSGIAPEFIALTAAVLGYLLLGVPLDIAARVYVRAFLVWQETRVLAWLAVVRLAVSVALFFVLTPYMGVPGIALADVAGIVLVLGGLAIAARRYLAGPVAGMRGSIIRLAAATGGGWLSATAIAALMGTVAPIPLILLVGTASLAIYMLLTWIFGVDELRVVRNLAFAWRAGRVQP
jgi:putative peptidoglycan lipid II flippase